MQQAERPAAIAAHRSTILIATGTRSTRIAARSAIRRLR